MEQASNETRGAALGSGGGGGVGARGGREGKTRVWRWSLVAGGITIALGAALLLMPPDSLFGFLKWAGWAYIAAAALELLVALANRGTPEARASTLLAIAGAIAGAILLLATTTRVFRLDHLLLTAIAIRAFSAGAVGMLVGAQGRGWILCRGLGEVAVALALLISVLAVLAAIPFASLSTGFLKSQTGYSDDLAALIAASLIVAGISQLLVALWPGRGGCDAGDA